MGLFEALKAWLGFVPPRSPAEAALLQAIAQAPHEDAPRLALARFWEDARQPQGEYIRLALECEQLDEFAPLRTQLQSRLDELVQKHGTTWLKPLQAVGLQPNAPGQPLPLRWFHRGLIENVWINRSGVVPEKLPQLLQLAPALRKLTFERIQPNWEAIAASPPMSRIAGLNLADAPLSLAELQLLANAAPLAGISELDLSNKAFGLPLVHTLAASTQWHNLQILDLQFCQLDAACAAFLASSTRFSTLRCLDLAHNQLGDAGAATLACSSNFNHVECLRLGDNQLTTAGLESLASGNFPKLRELNVESSEPGVAGLQSLAKASWANQLRTLHLGWNRAGDDAVAALFRPQNLNHLQRLYLNGNDLTDLGLQAILACPAASELRVLDLSSNDIHSAGIDALLASSRLKDLHTLVLYSVELTKRDRERLVERFGTTGVRF